MPKNGKEKNFEDELFEMEGSIDDLNSNYVVYGPNGAGKTTFVSFIDNLFLIDAEGGRSSIVKVGNKPTIFKPHMNELDKLSEAYVYLKAHEDKYDAVAIDTMTEIEQWFINDVIKTQCQRDPEKDKDLATQSDYNKASMRMRKMARLFRDLEMKTIFMMHVREDKDEENGRMVRSPAVMPSVYKDINSFTDFIFYLGVDENSKRFILTQPTRNYDAKHRIGELPDIIELGKDENECSIEKVLEMVDETKKEKEGAK